MTSESGVERDALPEDDTRAHPTESQHERDGDTIAGLSAQVAELIKDRDDNRDRANLLERTLIQQTATVADAEVEKLEALLELARERARQARSIAREAGGAPVAVLAFGFPGRRRAEQPNGKDA